MIVQPVVEPMERYTALAWDVSDLLQSDVALRHPVQHLLDVEEAAGGLDVEEREQLRGVLGDLPRDALVGLQPEQDELLNVLDDLRLPQVIDADPPEAREVLGDGGGLAGGEHGQQPAGEEVGVSGDQLGDAAARLTSGRAPGADQLQVQPVHCQDQDLGVAVVYCAVLYCTGEI